MEKYYKFRIILIILSVLGSLVSTYLIFNHFNGGNSVCDISKTISCSTANGSVYSVFLGIPVSILGLLWFLMVLYFATGLQFRARRVLSLLVGSGILGFISIVYFIHAEISVGALCLGCSVAHVLIFATLLISLYLYFKETDHEKWWLSVHQERMFILLVALLVLILFVTFNWKFWFL